MRYSNDDITNDADPMQPITAFVLDRILVFLAPLFLAGADGNLQDARVVAAETLRAYGARTEQELSLAAQVIAFSLRALDTLARAAEPDLDIKAVLRLNGSAASLHRAAMRARKELDRLRAQPIACEPPVQGEDVQGAEIDPAAVPEPPAAAPRASCAQPIATPPIATPPIAVPPSSPEPVPLAPPPVQAPPDRPATAILSRRQRRLAEREWRRQQDRIRQVEHTRPELRQQEAAP